MGVNVVLTVVQLLLINLAMDTLAAIAFGSEPALKEYMKDKPVPRKESIVTKKMFVQILISAFYITFVCLGILFIPFMSGWFGNSANILASDGRPVYLCSALFATFMMAISWNGFNARTEHINVFEHIGRNKTFLIVMLIIFAMQFIFVTFGGDFLNVHALEPLHWLICIGISIMVIPIDMIRKAITKAISKQ